MRKGLIISGLVLVALAFATSADAAPPRVWLERVRTRVQSRLVRPWLRFAGIAGRAAADN